MRNQELQWYQPDNATVKNGIMTIAAQKVHIANPNYVAGSTDWKTNRQFYDYTSTSMTTSGKHAFMYGRFEIRARIDTRQGSWPAFWILGSGTSWPQSGEVDIMEYYANKVLANVCTPMGSNCGWDSIAQQLSSLGSTWSSNFHVWAMEWDAQKISLYLDDKLVNDYAVSTVQRLRPDQPLQHQVVLHPGQPGAGRRQRRRSQRHDVPDDLRSRLRPRVPARDRPVKPSFRGFDRDAMQFWHELASEMSKEWFTANKQRYQSLWVEPMMTLLREVARGLAPAYKPLTLAEPGVLRIYRDLRFSADKTPYKTHIAGVIRLGGARIAEAGNAVLYLHVGLDEEFVGVGCYQFDAARTARWRRAVVGKPGSGAAADHGQLAPEGLRARRLRILTRASPRASRPITRARSCSNTRGSICRFPAIPAGLLHRPELARWLLGHAKATAPLVVWLRRYLG